MTGSGQQGNVEPRARSPRPLDPGVTIGHVHLRTSDIDRVRWFYVDVLGFDVVTEARDVPGWGTTGDILFVSAGGAPQPDGVAGLHHVAIRYPTRDGLEDALRRLRAIDWPIRQATDHGPHLSIYLADPDGNGLELSGTARSRSGPATLRVTSPAGARTSTRPRFCSGTRLPTRAAACSSARPASRSTTGSRRAAGSRPARA